MPRFVRLLDAARGEFADVIDAMDLPRPLAIADALTVNEYVRSYWVEVYDWSTANALDCRPELDLADPTDRDVRVSEAEDLASGWQIRILARLGPSSPVKALFGEQVSPPLF